MALANYCVAMCDGGGGAVDYSTLLSMKEVLDQGSTEQTTRVLYAETIDSSAVSAIIDNLATISEAGGVGQATSTLIGENEEMMAASNSDRFYTNSDAQDQFSAMGQVNTKLLSLLGNIDNIVNNKATIIANIDSYNTKLKELKKDCRINLLKKAADAWNLAKHRDRVEHVEKSDYYPQKSTVFGDSQYVYSEPINIKTNYGTGSGYGAAAPTYEYDRVYYKIIKYWTGIKNITWFRDPGFAEVEKMFADVGATLPYNPDLILPKE
jgi:hypothetical protein